MLDHRSGTDRTPPVLRTLSFSDEDRLRWVRVFFEAISLSRPTPLRRAIALTETVLGDFEMDPAEVERRLFEGGKSEEPER